MPVLGGRADYAGVEESASPIATSPRGQRSGRHKAEPGAVMSVNDLSRPQCADLLREEAAGALATRTSVYVIVAKDLTWSCWGQTPAPLTAIPADPLAGHPPAY